MHGGGGGALKRPLALGSGATPGRKKSKSSLHGGTGTLKRVLDLGEAIDPMGSVHESDAAHWERHSTDATAHGKCCRCNFIRAKAEFKREHPWLTPRPIHMGGRWRLGCDVCAWKHSNAGRERHETRRGNTHRASKWANSQFYCHGLFVELRYRVKAHAADAGHRASVIASQRCLEQLTPRLLSAGHDVIDRPLAAAGATSRPLAGERPAGDAASDPTLISDAESEVVGDSVLKGRVPQCQDWLDAWSECTEHISFRKQARVLAKRGRLKLTNLRKIRRKQIRIIAEVRREDIRHQLREAQFISISMDDRQYQKIVRFVCDAPEKPFFRKGILGVMGLEKSAVGDFEEDHAVIAVRKLDSFLNRLCTPLGRQSRPLAADIALKEHVRKCTRTFAADGAQRTEGLATCDEELFPNVVLLLRDPAHALRIAVRDPLHFDSLFGEVWNTLFDKRHALVPDVMNSKKWQDLLQNIQRVVLRMPSESRPLAVVLKHLRFAKQRFDSSADPVAKVLATMLAYIGSDQRHKPCDRERAKTLLKKLGSKFALAIGVSADWGLVTQAFLRIFDKSAHDIAKTDSEIRAFGKVMRFCLHRGAYFPAEARKNIRPTQLPAIGGYFGTAGVKPMFVTEHIEKMLRQRVVFNCGSEQVLLWGAPKAADVEEVWGAERQQPFFSCPTFHFLSFPFPLRAPHHPHSGPLPRTFPSPQRDVSARARAALHSSPLVPPLPPPPLPPSSPRASPVSIHSPPPCRVPLTYLAFTPPHGPLPPAAARLVARFLAPQGCREFARRWW